MFADIGSGFREQGKEDLRSRQQLATAFNQFRATNPEATLADFQSFIDQMSGGRNYLRGGAPSQEVLQGIAGRNEEARRARLARENLEALKYKAETQGYLDSQIDRYILQYEDPDEARIRFEEDMGGQLAGAGFDYGGAFSNKRKDRVFGNLALEKWPQAEQILKATARLEDGAPSINAVDLASRVGVPREVAEDYLRRWEDLEKERLADRAAQQRKDMQLNREAIINQAIKLAENHAPADAIRRTIGNIYGPDADIEPEVIQPLVDEVENRREQARAETERAQNDRNRQLVRDETAYFRSLIETGTIKNAILQDNVDLAIGMLQQEFDALPEETKELLGPDFLNRIVTEDVTRGRQLQDETRAANKAAAAETTREIYRTFDANNLKAAEDSFGGADTVTGQVAKVLAQSYHMDPKATVALTAAFQDAGGKNATPAELMAAGKAALEGAATPLPEARDREVEKTLRSLGQHLDGDVRMDEWAEMQTSRTNDLVSTVTSKIDDAISSEDPRQLALLDAYIQRELEAFQSDIENDARNATDDPNSILTYGSGPWDVSMQQKVLQDYQAAAQELRQRIATAASTMAPPEQTQPGVRMPSESQSRGGQVLGGLGSRISREAALQWRMFVNDLGDIPDDVRSWAQDPEAAYVADTMRDKFLRDEGVLQQLRDDPEAWKEWREDEMGFILGSDRDWVKAYRDRVVQELGLTGTTP